MQNEPGVDSPVSRPGLTIRVGVSSARVFQKVVGCRGAPGDSVKATICFRGLDGKFIPERARILAFIDPLTGKAVVRMGMVKNDDETGSGQEVDSQVVWNSDVPVYQLGGVGEGD